MVDLVSTGGNSFVYTWERVGPHDTSVNFAIDDMSGSFLVKNMSSENVFALKYQ